MGCDESEDGFVQALERMVADTRAGDVVRDRVRERGLRRAAEEESTLAGLVLDLSERQAQVGVRTSTRRTHRGRIIAVGRDFLVVRDGGAPPVFIALEALVALRPTGVIPEDTVGRRRAPLDLSFAGVLGELAAERSRVQVVTVDGDATSGTLRAMGTDVLTMAVDAEGRVTIHLALHAVAEVVLVDR